MVRDLGGLIRDVFLILLMLVALAVALYYVLYVIGILPIRFANLLQMVVAVIVGYLVVKLLATEIKSFSSKMIGERRARNISILFQYVGYIIIAVFVLSLAGIGGIQLLAGGAFAGLVLGLAGQTVLSNVFAGIMLLVSRPFEIGERITIVTSQYGLIVPSYPPKYFSDDKLIPGYTGVVENIGLLYSTLRLDEGNHIKMPNNILIQAAVITQEVSARIVKVRFQAPSSLQIKTVIESITEEVSKNEWIADPQTVKVYIEEIDRNYYIMSLEALCKGQDEESAKTSLILAISNLVRG